MIGATDVLFTLFGCITGFAIARAITGRNIGDCIFGAVVLAGCLLVVMAT